MFVSNFFFLLQIRCVSNYLDQVVDLSSLIRVTQNYRASAPDGREFFINVCRPVISVNGLSCPAGSGACVAKQVDKTYKEELVSKIINK
jgi:insulin-like growth factor 2 receptor